MLGQDRLRTRLEVLHYAERHQSVEGAVREGERSHVGESETSRG